MKRHKLHIPIALFLTMLFSFSTFSAAAICSIQMESGCCCCENPMENTLNITENCECAVKTAIIPKESEPKFHNFEILLNTGLIHSSLDYLYAEINNPQSSSNQLISEDIYLLNRTFRI